MKKQLGPKPFIFPMPALLVGTYGPDGTPNALTAAWTGVCCQKPLCVGVAIRHNRFTFENLDRKPEFTLNVPNTSMVTEVDYLGIVSGRDVPDKIKHAKIETKPGTLVEAPILLQCPVNLECKVVNQIELGTHWWFIGEILETHVNEELLDDNNKMNIKAVDPLMYIISTSEYRSIGDVVGHAFSDGKKLKS